MGKTYKWTGLGETKEYIDRASRIRSSRKDKNPFRRLPKAVSK